MIEYDRDLGTVKVTAANGSSQNWELAVFEANAAACILATGNNFEVAKDKVVAELAAARWEKTQTLVYDGVTLNPDSTSKVIADRLFAYQVLRSLGQPVPEKTNWDLAGGNYRELTEADMVQLGLACMAHIQGCFDSAKAVSEAINSCDVPEALDALNTALATGWPWNLSAPVTPEQAKTKIIEVRTAGRESRSHYLKAANGQVTYVRDGAVVKTFDPAEKSPDADAYNMWVDNGGTLV